VTKRHFENCWQTRKQAVNGTTTDLRMGTDDGLRLKTETAYPFASIIRSLIH
jgi:hypothetical protein